MIEDKCPECDCDNWTGSCGHLDCGACSIIRAEKRKLQERYEKDRKQYEQSKLCESCGEHPHQFRAYMYHGEDHDHSVALVCKTCALEITDEQDGSWITLPTRSNVLSFEEIDKPCGPWAGMDQSVPFNHPY